VGQGRIEALAVVPREVVRLVNQKRAQRFDGEVRVRRSGRAADSSYGRWFGSSLGARR
jgi:hypothetical protein